MKTKPNISPCIPILLLSLVVALVTSSVISPLYMQVRNDVMIMYTIMPIVLEYAIILLETVYIALLCSATAYSVYGIMKGDEKKSTLIPLIASVVFFKHALNLAISSIIDGYIDISFDIPTTLMQFAADILLLLVVATVARSKWSVHFAYAEKLQKASKYIASVEYDENETVYPFNGLFNFKHPVVYSLFVGSIITLVILVVQRIYADIMLGLPASFLEIIEIVLAYTADALTAIIGYVAAYYAASYIFLKKTTTKNN